MRSLHLLVLREIRTRSFNGNLLVSNDQAFRSRFSRIPSITRCLSTWNLTCFFRHCRNLFLWTGKPVWCISEVFFTERSFHSPCQFWCAGARDLLLQTLRLYQPLVGSVFKGRIHMKVLLELIFLFLKFQFSYISKIENLNCSAINFLFLKIVTEMVQILSVQTNLKIISWFHKYNWFFSWLCDLDFQFIPQKPWN